MCELCNIERGRREVLMESDLDMALGNISLNELTTGVYVNQSNNGHYTIEFWMYRKDGHPVHEMGIPLKYCPFCGRELPHYEEKIIPCNE